MNDRIRTTCCRAYVHIVDTMFNIGRPTCSYCHSTAHFRRREFGEQHLIEGDMVRPKAPRNGPTYGDGPCRVMAADWHTILVHLPSGKTISIVETMIERVYE